MESERNKLRNKRHAFTLVELMIVVAILGILAAVVLPTFQGHITEAKEAAAKDTLRILRNAIELYASQHNGVAPGYPDDNTSATPLGRTFYSQMVNNGNYLTKRVENPFNNKTVINMINNDQDLPTEPAATDRYGWVYKPATKTIRLNWSGTDSKGVAYFDY